MEKKRIKRTPFNHLEHYCSEYIMSYETASTNIMMSHQPTGFKILIKASKPS